jgi:hypothetical protein
MRAMPAQMAILFRPRADHSAAVSDALCVRRLDAAPHTASPPTLRLQPNSLPRAVSASAV